MKLRRKFSVFLYTIAALLVGLAAAIVFGGPARPPAMPTINDPFKGVDFSAMPPLSWYAAADGFKLAYRDYAPAATPGIPATGSVVLVHGSSASSKSMHPMAMALAAKGFRVFALDMRGHGESGAKGHVDFIGQLESDLQAFLAAVKPPAPSTLAGFSSGGGFVLRFAGSSRQEMFDSYLLLSPFLSQSAPNYRADAGGWANVGLPRIIGLAALNLAGFTAFNHLPVTSFALNDQARAVLTPEYSYNLAMNFRPQRDWEANLRSARRPTAVVAGSDDEIFHTDRLETIFRAAGQDWPVRLLPGIKHIPLTLDPAALDTIARQVQGLQRRGV